MNRSVLLLLFAFSLLTAGVYVLAAPLLLPGTTERASVAYNGQEANEYSSEPAVSADGRYVVFYSEADNLVPDDYNGTGDVFVRDRMLGTILRIPAQSSGNPTISADGRFVIFASNDPTLVPDDTNGYADVFIYHTQTGAIERVSVGSGGQQANGWSTYAFISTDGRFIVFTSASSNLSPIPSNSQQQLYVYDRETSQTEMVTVSTQGVSSNQGGGYQSISADGQYVVFSSWANNLVPDDTNNKGDVFVRDRLDGVTWRITVGPTGEQGNENSYNSSISANGRYVAFTSFANNLVPDDTNNRADAFVHDLVTGETERINLTLTGQQSSEHGGVGNISADGRFVTFVSSDSNLVMGDTNDTYDVFVRDRVLGFNERLNLSTEGEQTYGSPNMPLIGAEGRFTVFLSGDTNLVPTDTNKFIDVFLRDRPLTAVDLNYSTGAPGSYFTVNGHNLPLTNTATLEVNGYTLGSVATDSTGSFTAILSTTLASPGAYYVTAGVAPYEATTLLLLNPDAPVRPLEGSGPVFVIPAGIAWHLQFLPVVFHQE